MYRHEVVLVSVCPPHDSRFLRAMNAMVDLEEYEILRLKVANPSEVFEDLVVHHSTEIALSNERGMSGFMCTQNDTAPYHRIRHIQSTRSPFLA